MDKVDIVVRLTFLSLIFSAMMALVIFVKVFIFKDRAYFRYFNSWHLTMMMALIIDLTHTNANMIDD